MNDLQDWLIDMVSEEESAVDEYIDLANELSARGVPKSVSEKIFRIADDENRHKKILVSVLKYLGG